MSDALIYSVGGIAINILFLIRMVVIAAVIAQLLVNFNVISITNDFVRQVYHGSQRFTDMLCNPIRRFLPDMGGFDFSPVIVIILIWGLMEFIAKISGHL